MPEEYRTLIEHAYQDEINASRFYYNLSRTAANPTCAALIATASNDEYRHAQMLSVLLAGGCPPMNAVVDASQVSPADLEKAVEGELEAICEYATLARLAPTMEERLLFFTIIGDEFGHMRMFTAMQATGCV